MSDQPMREMSLIELITSLPKTHIARKEHTKFLGRLSKEKNERLHLEQEVKELKALQEKYVWVTREEMKAHSDIEQELSGKSLAQHDKEQVTFGVTDFVGTVLEHGELCGHDSDFLVECKKEYIKQLQEQE